MEIPTPEQLTRFEREVGRTLPPSLHALVLGPTDDLRARFPVGEFVLTRSAYKAARREGVPSKLVPFFLDAQGGHRDYYCFNLATPAPEYGVSMFALHAVIEAWPDLSAWRASA